MCVSALVSPAGRKIRHEAPYHGLFCHPIPSVANPGVARMPYPVFRGIVRTFSTCRAETHVYSLRWATNGEWHGLPPSSNLSRLTRLAKFGGNAFELRVTAGSIIPNRESCWRNVLRTHAFLLYSHADVFS